MAWDTEQTRRRLKQAAKKEFAEHGPHGTTVERIAARAGINKERLYRYFGGKQALFATVLTEELDKLAAAVPVPTDRIEDIGELAAATFDYHAAHPELVRLLQWEGLSGVRIADTAERTSHYQRKVREVAEAQRAGVLDPAIAPDHLVFLIIAIAAWWFSVPQVALMLTGADTDGESEHERRRSCVAEAARRLALPPAAGESR